MKSLMISSEIDKSVSIARAIQMRLHIYIFFYLDKLTHQEAIKLIKSGGDQLVLALQRGTGHVPEIPKGK